MRLVAVLLIGLAGHQTEGRIWGGSASQKVLPLKVQISLSPVGITNALDGRSLGFEGESVMASDWFSMDPFHGAGWGSGWPKVEDQPKSGKLATNAILAKETASVESGESTEISKEFEIVPNLTEAAELGIRENGGNSENWKTLKTGSFSSKVKSGGKLTNLKLHKDSSRRPENSKPELEKINEVSNYLRKVCQSTNSRDVVGLCKELQIEVRDIQKPTRKFHPSELLTIDWKQVVKDAMRKRNEERFLEFERKVAAAKETENHLFFHPHGFKRRKAPVGMVDSIRGALIKLISPLSGRRAWKPLSQWDEKHSLKKSFRISPTNPKKRFQLPNKIAKVAGTNNNVKRQAQPKPSIKRKFSHLSSLQPVLVLGSETSNCPSGEEIGGQLRPFFNEGCFGMGRNRNMQILE